MTYAWRSSLRSVVRNWSTSAAVGAGQLLPAAAENIRAFLAAGLPAWAEESISELVGANAWGELNDRFYRFLEFGTGGMRGRTIGVTATTAERGGSFRHWGDNGDDSSDDSHEGSGRGGGRAAAR